MHVGATGTKHTVDRRCWEYFNARLAKSRKHKATEKAEKVVDTALDPQKTNPGPIRWSYARAETRRSPDVQELHSCAPPQLYDELLLRLQPRLQRKCTRWRQPTGPGLRLALTVRFLATGDSYQSIAYDFLVPHNTISGIVTEVCDAIVEEYMEEVLDTPMQPHQWAEIADEFSRRWNLPHCVGAVDGKHVAIRKPKKGGSVFWNYKGYNSVVLMAMVDADYKFRWVQVCDPGSYSDGQIWKEADLKVAIESNVAGLSDPSPVPADNQPMPFFLVGWSTEPHPGCRRSGSQRCSWGVERRCSDG